MRIGIIAAMPGELRPLVSAGFVRLRTAKSSGVKMWQSEIGGADVVAVCAGMGAAAARRAFTAAEHAGSLDLVLSVGWAGALTEDLVAGGTYIASAVIDANTGERFQLGAGERQEILVSTDRVALAPEKRRLAATYRASMVDMEAATILRLAQMRQIPAMCFKAISDESGEDLPDLNRYIDVHGKLKITVFAMAMAVKPEYWGSLLRLGRSSSQGAKSLASAILTFLSGPKDVDEVNRTGNVDW